MIQLLKLQDSVYVLKVIQLVSKAYGKVKPETVYKCFCKANILDEDFNATVHVAEEEADTDLFREQTMSTSLMIYASSCVRLLLFC